MVALWAVNLNANDTAVTDIWGKWQTGQPLHRALCDDGVNVSLVKGTSARSNLMINFIGLVPLKCHNIHFYSVTAELCLPNWCVNKASQKNYSDNWSQNSHFSRLGLDVPDLYMHPHSAAHTKTPGYILTNTTPRAMITLMVGISRGCTPMLI